jgi:hypothetical protein
LGFGCEHVVKDVFSRPVFPEEAITLGHEVCETVKQVRAEAAEHMRILDEWSEIRVIDQTQVLPITPIRPRAAIRNDLCHAILHLRLALGMATVREAADVTAKFAVLVKKPDGTGRIAAEFDATLIDDMALYLDYETWLKTEGKDERQDDGGSEPDPNRP